MTISWLPTNKKKIAIIIFAAICIIGAYWLFTHSRVSVEVSGALDGEEITYTFRDTSSGDAKQIKSSSPKITAWIKKGAYEITSSSKKGNFIAFVPSTPIFYKSEVVKGELETERSRIFVGEQVRPCAGVAGSLVISGGCEGVYGALSVHKSATKTTPAYIINNPDRSIFGQNQILVSTGGSMTQIIKSAASATEGTEEGPGSVYTYTAVSLSNDLRNNSKTELTDLKGADQYFFKAIKNGGFIAYKSNPDLLYEYSSDGKKTRDIRTQQPQVQTTTMTSIDYINSSNYAALYTHQGNSDKQSPYSEVILNKDGDTKRYSFSNKSYYSLVLCSTTKICLLDNEGRLDVYATSGDEAEYDYSASHVSLITSTANTGGVYVVNDVGVLNLSVDSRSGHIEYSFGDYEFNEINVHKNGYLLGLKNNKSKIVGLYVDQSIEDVDSIDSKIADLQKMPEVGFVSINGNYIYISANLKLVYSEQKKGHAYDESARKNAADNINKKIEELKIDRSKYTITSNAF